MSASSEAYHLAVARGRHPRSFPQNSDVWKYVKDSKKRLELVHTGQHLWSVVDEEEAQRRANERIESDASRALDEMQAADKHSLFPVSTYNTGPSIRPTESLEAKRSKLSHRMSQYRIKSMRELDKKALKKKKGAKDETAAKAELNDAETVPKPTQSHGKEKNKKSAVSRLQASLPKDGAKDKDLGGGVGKSHLSQEFSTQPDARLHFGAQVAFENVFYGNKYLQVQAPHGDVFTRSLQESGDSRVLFQVLDMNDLQCADPIKYGDSIWLQVTAGSGDSGWEHGSVLGAQLREAPQLETVGLRPDSEIRNPSDVTQTIGQPFPVSAVLPKGREDGDNLKDALVHVHSSKNKKPKLLGRWKILPATKAARKMELGDITQDEKNKDKDKKVASAHQIRNLSEVYLEQDWFFLMADPSSDRSILRQLPTKEPTGEYVLDRRGVWRIKLLDSTSQTGLTLVQQQMERLLYKAKNQLKQSKSMRDGQNEYQKNLSGGTRFAKQIRQKLRKINDRSDQKLVSREQEKAEHLPEFFYQKFSSTSIDSLPIFPSQPQAMSNASMPNLGDWKSKSMPNLGDNLRLQGQASQKPPSRARPGNTRTTTAGSLEGGDRRRHKTLLSPIQLQDLRHKLCGHFPAYYDLPRMLSILGEQETQVKSMLADEMKHMQAYGGQTAPAGGLGAMGRDQAMLAAMNDKNSLVQELKSEDETMIWNINYKEKYQKFSGLYDSLYDNLDDSRDGGAKAAASSASAQTAQSPGAGDVDGDSTFITTAQTADQSADDNGSRATGDSGVIMDVEAALERFAGNRQHLEDMMLSLQKLCEERVLPQLEKSLAEKDQMIVKEEAEFLKEAGEIIAADAVASAANQLIALVDQSGSESGEKLALLGKQCIAETRRLLDFVSASFLNKQPGDGGGAAGEAATAAAAAADAGEGEGAAAAQG